MKVRLRLCVNCGFCWFMLPGRSFQFPADADVDLHGLQRPLLLWFDALNNNTDQSEDSKCLLVHTETSSHCYLLVFKQQQFVVFDLERSLLEPVSLKKLRRFLTTLQQTDLHDLTLIGCADRQAGKQVERETDR